MSTTLTASRGVSPDPSAKDLAEEMFGMDDVMRDILDETIPRGDGEKVYEAGRTLCGTSSEIHGPLARFPTAIELASCPRGTRGGTWHTHVTQDQLRNPTNSLPDTANVIFGEVDVSIVVGTETAEAVVAAEDRDVAVEVFGDTIGTDVSDTDDVVDAIISGSIEDAPDARRRVRDRMSSLFDQRRTGFSDLADRLDMSSIPASATVSFEMMDARHHAMVAQQLRGTQSRSHNLRKNPVRSPGRMRSHIRQKNQGAKRTVRDVDVPKYALRSAVGEVVHRAFRSVL